MRLIKKLPILVLLISFIVRISLNLITPSPFYEFDEIIVTHISRQESKNLLDSVAAEPHPPGFYFILKLVPTQNVQLLKILALIVSFVLIFLVVVFAYRKNLIERYKLTWGLSFFFSSFTFVNITSRIKQDLITFPILVFIFFTALYLTKEGKKRNNSVLVIITQLFCIFLMFFGYVAFFQALLIVFFITFFINKEKLPKYLFSLPLIFLISFLLLFGFNQFGVVSNRFIWVDDFNNSFLNSLVVHLTGTSFINGWPDAAVIFFLTLIFISLVKPPKGLKKMVSPLFVVAICLTVFSYLARLFVRLRYVAFLYLILSILVGWGIEAVKSENYIKKTRIIYLFLLLFLFSNIIFNWLGEIQRSKQQIFINSQLNKFAKEKKVGLLTEHPTASLVYKLGNNLSENVVALNIFFPDLFKKARIDRNTLEVEGFYTHLDEGQVKSQLAKTKLNDFYYFLGLRFFPIDQKGESTYYDPERSVFKVLNGSCGVTRVVNANPFSLLFVFQDCDFGVI